MNTETAAKCLESLGHPTRLGIYQLLVRAGKSGLVVGEVQRMLAVPGSTLSHHLAHLVKVDLVHQERHGRELRCLANYETMTDMLVFLTQECCAGFIEPRQMPSHREG